MMTLIWHCWSRISGPPESPLAVMPSVGWALSRQALKSNGLAGCGAAAGIVEVDPVEVLRIDVRARSEQEILELVERGERAEHVVGRAAAEIDPAGRAGGAGAVIAIAVMVT